MSVARFRQHYVLPLSSFRRKPESSARSANKNWTPAFAGVTQAV